MSDPCTQAATLYRSGFRANGTSSGAVSATVADQCMRSLAFNRSQAIIQLRQIRYFMQLYSYQAFWKKPPNGFEYHAIDLNATLDAISRKIMDCAYESSYDFDFAMSDALASFNDGHTYYGTLSSRAFTFVHDYPLVSISQIPNEDPEIFIGDAVSGGPLAGGKVALIDGQDPNIYLENLAIYSPLGSWVDLDARYNSLFVHRIIPKTESFLAENLGIFAARDRLPPEHLAITLSNGTVIHPQWQALYNYLGDQLNSAPPELPFKSTATFNYYSISGISYNFSDTVHQTLQDASPNRYTLDAIPAGYPKPINSMPFNGCFYFSLDSDIGVLVIPTFLPSSLLSFSRMINYDEDISIFIKEALSYFKSKGHSKVIVDLSNNPGGSIDAVYAAFREFFPQATPDYYEDLRYSPLLDDICSAVANESRPLTLNPVEFAIDFRMTQGGKKFKSWRDFCKPTSKVGDYFTARSRKNASAILQQNHINLSAFPLLTHFKATNVILMGNSLCSSSCSTFAHAMQEQGVRSVVFGGRPGSKILQVSGGVKGYVEDSFT